MNEPLTHGEFDSWQQEHFIPHVKQGDEHDKKVDRLTLGAFGDGNGNAGAFQDVKDLKRMQTRIDAWLDLLRRVWQILGSLVVVLAAIATIAKMTGYI